jgi:hypothetical protein
MTAAQLLSGKSCSLAERQWWPVALMDLAPGSRKAATFHQGPDRCRKGAVPNELDYFSYCIFERRLHAIIDTIMLAADVARKRANGK